jgi:hypothetical protein
MWVTGWGDGRGTLFPTVAFSAEVLAFDDVTQMGVDWIANQQLRLGQAAERNIALTIGMVVGERMREMVANFGRNLVEGRVRPVMGICRAA